MVYDADAGEVSSRVGDLGSSLVLVGSITLPPGPLLIYTRGVVRATARLIPAKGEATDSITGTLYEAS